MWKVNDSLHLSPPDLNKIDKITYDLDQFDDSGGDKCVET